MAPRAAKKDKTASQEKDASIEKTIDTKQVSKRIAGKVKKNKKRVVTHNRYIHKVLQQVHPAMRISQTAMSVMSSFVNDLYGRFAGEAANLCKLTGRRTMTSREVQTAARLVLPGELARRLRRQQGSHGLLQEGQRLKRHRSNF
ncbi:hypothetical protein L596_014033 [Steinernema carpocapsae]|uniref:Core Histone H2A/H2B/H3 domain-containing protein n=1 Tax=Steinernema carpocapsae TaxID=34508 RepID=A0A4U5NA68_STECR|nr:hypothetical protein L596_014033 [Steinernema carpocapsae]